MGRIFTGVLATSTTDAYPLNQISLLSLKSLSALSPNRACIPGVLSILNFQLRQWDVDYSRVCVFVHAAVLYHKRSYLFNLLGKKFKVFSKNFQEAGWEKSSNFLSYLAPVRGSSWQA